MNPSARIRRRRLLAAVARHDGALFDFICSRRTDALNRLMILASRSGDGASYLALAVLGVLAGGALGQGLVGAAAAGGLASVVAYGVKRLIARPRPTCESPLRIALVEPPDAWSFPSAHTATAVAAACALGAAFGPVAFSCAIAWGLFVGISRVYVGAHYPLDVLMGGALGIGVYAALGELARDLGGILVSAAS
jgi:undecaprenyl-diphosphatase